DGALLYCPLPAGRGRAAPQAGNRRRDTDGTSGGRIRARLTLKEQDPMAEAYIYDAVRTPRGRGKATGRLHEITPIQLATQVLQAVRDRTGIDTADVDDVVLGCVAPVGEQGSDIARVAVLNADYAETTAGVQINRFCASGLEATNMAAAKVMSGEADFAIG